MLGLAGINARNVDFVSKSAVSWLVVEIKDQIAGLIIHLAGVVANHVKMFATMEQLIGKDINGIVKIKGVDKYV